MKHKIRKKKSQQKTPKKSCNSEIKHSFQEKEIVMKLFGLDLGQFWDKVLGGEIAYIGQSSGSDRYRIVQRGGHSGNTSRYSQPSDIAIILHSEIDYISRCILDYKRIETGGQLFGHWTVDGTPIVLYAIGPGPHANHQSAFFNQDIEYLETIGKFLYERYGLHHIGEWHSHHQLGLAQPSGHDATTMVESIRENHLGRFLLCIGNCTDTSSTLNAFNFSEDAGYEYVNAKWLVKENEGIPYRELIDRDLERFLIHPNTPRPCHGNLNLVNEMTPQASSPQYAQGYWFNDKHNRVVFKSIMDKLKEHSCHECSVQMDDKGYIHLTVHYEKLDISIFFTENFPNTPPDIGVTDYIYGKRCYWGTWTFNGDIYKSFIEYYNQILKQLQNQ